METKHDGVGKYRKKGQEAEENEEVIREGGVSPGKELST